MRAPVLRACWANWLCRVALLRPPPLLLLMDIYINSANVAGRKPRSGYSWVRNVEEAGGTEEQKRTQFQNGSLITANALHVFLDSDLESTFRCRISCTIRDAECVGIAQSGGTFESTAVAV